jgi:diacylglycerol kinase (ATP)
LARALNWGGAYTNESLSKLLAKTLESRNVKLDRWKILTQVNQSVDLKQQSNKENSSTENAIEKLKNDVMNNYFSIGADAHVCLEFHERRGTDIFSSSLFNLKRRKTRTSIFIYLLSTTEANPHKFTSRWFNLLQYVEAGSKDFIKKTWKDLKDYIELEVK